VKRASEKNNPIIFSTNGPLAVKLTIYCGYLHPFRRVMHYTRIVRVSENSLSYILRSCSAAVEINPEIVQRFHRLAATGFLTRFSQSALQIHNKSYRKQRTHLALSVYGICTLGKFCGIYGEDLSVNITLLFVSLSLNYSQTIFTAPLFTCLLVGNAQ
jgi:hypothetical protein